MEQTLNNITRCASKPELEKVVETLRQEQLVPVRALVAATGRLSKQAAAACAQEEKMLLSQAVRAQAAKAKASATIFQENSNDRPNARRLALASIAHSA